jgi:hypothetical protein
MKLNTVNVIEFTNGNLQSLRAFAESPEGNKAAEELFVKCINENKSEIPDGDNGLAAETWLDNGYFNSGCGYEIYLTHST